MLPVSLDCSFYSAQEREETTHKKERMQQATLGAQDTDNIGYMTL
jgi:hypothetical protein